MPIHTLGRVPHSRSLLNVTACTQMQIEAWDCVSNQSCTLIHTSNDEDVPIQLVFDIVNKKIVAMFDKLRFIHL